MKAPQFRSLFSLVETDAEDSECLGFHWAPHSDREDTEIIYINVPSLKDQKKQLVCWMELEEFVCGRQRWAMFGLLGGSPSSPRAHELPRRSVYFWWATFKFVALEQ